MTIATRRHAILLAALGLLAACAEKQTAATQAPPSRPADATVEMEELQVAFIGSGDGGSGVLHYRGRDYPISVAGMGVGGIGASKIEAQGEVFNMPDIAKFAGTYGRARAGYAVGEASADEMWMQNTSGVVLRLRARREGLMLSLGGDALVVSFR